MILKLISVIENKLRHIIRAIWVDIKLKKLVNYPYYGCDCRDDEDSGFIEDKQPISNIRTSERASGDLENGFALNIFANKIAKSRDKLSQMKICEFLAYLVLDPYDLIMGGINISENTLNAQINSIYFGVYLSYLR